MVSLATGSKEMRASSGLDYYARTTEGLPPVRPPPGIVPELQNPPQARQAGNIAGLVTCMCVATILFAVRSYVKFRIRRTYLVEDVTCTIAWVLLIYYASCVFLMISYDTGYGSENINREDYAEMLKWLYISSLAYCPTAFFTKVTLLLLTARVFSVKTGVTHTIYGFILVLVLSYIPIEVAKIDICNPIEAYWNPGVNGKCLRQRDIFLADLGVAITTDFVILVVPIPLTWRMRKEWQKKLKIVGMLGAGGSALAVTIYRLVLVTRSTDSHGPPASDFILLDLLQIIEIAIGLACSCLPALNILLTHHLSNRKWLASLRGSHEASGSSQDQAQDPHQCHSCINRTLCGMGLCRLGPSTARKVSSPGDGTTTMTSGDMTRVFSDTSAAPPRRETAMPSMVPRWEGGEDCLWRDRQEWEEEQQAREKGRQIDFDLELAMLSPSGRFSSTAPMEGDPHNSWFVAERANSLDGRRNGWLEDSSGDTEEGEMGSGSGGGGDCDDCAKSSGSCGHLKVKLSSGRSRGSSSDRKQGSIEMELAKVTGNKPWEMIYDGRSNL